jgi:hypothetical protein
VIAVSLHNRRWSFGVCGQYDGENMRCRQYFRTADDSEMTSCRMQDICLLLKKNVGASDLNRGT